MDWNWIEVNEVDEEIEADEEIDIDEEIEVDEKIEVNEVDEVDEESEVDEEIKVNEVDEEIEVDVEIEVDEEIEVDKEIAMIDVSNKNFSYCSATLNLLTFPFARYACKCFSPIHVYFTWSHYLLSKLIYFNPRAPV